MPRRSFYVRESEMDDFQRKIINRKSDTSIIVTGCAGSGKSVLAFWKYHDIKQKQQGTVQIVVFTTTLKDFFIEGCKSANIDPHGIFHWKEWQKHPYSSDYILVDEAQDFSEEEIRYFMQCANKALLLYGDSSQQVYRFLDAKEGPRMSMNEIQRITSYPLENLAFNYRLPQTIARVAEYILPQPDLITDRCTVVGSEKPYFLECACFDEQLKQIANIIKTRGYDDVGILLPRNDEVKYAANTLKSLGLSIEAKYKEGTRNISNLSFATNNPKVMTYHSAKGLQFGAVFLPDCQQDKLSNFLEPLYVAMTRTYDTLYVLYSGALPAELQPILDSDLVETHLTTKKTELL